MPTDEPDYLPPVLTTPCALCAATLANFPAIVDDPYADRDDAPASDDVEGAA